MPVIKIVEVIVEVRDYEKEISDELEEM